ncbi:alpha/beta hydrolase [Sphingomonas crusticola]|uniref:alpha/beta hydrolase n=1 Tax=Sphingomonas crusticola TaxID=1697973 RepID=UPI001F07866D|nr:alpha/beta hydrolase [Sphingomonas crusticola]
MAFDTWVAADGWALRSFAWPQPGPARGSILFLNGRGDFIEKYLEPLIHWHEQGWTVAGFDWRGQGGSGRLLADPLICHQLDFDPMVQDLAGFVAQWAATTPAPHVIVAHSMGAHLTLRMLARGTHVIDAAILASPMIDIRVMGVPGWALRWLAGLASLAGLAERPVSRKDIGDVGGRMTSCPERRADKAWWKASRPELASGVASWSWVRAARTSIRRLRRRDIAALDIPVLVITSQRDPVVDVRAIARLARTLPEAELMQVPGGGHELLREANARRLPIMARIDAFLDRIGPPLSC